jgi:hypothetical protein
MHRKRAEEGCERIKRLEATELKRKCARFVADRAEAIARGEPQIPPGLANRAADIWEPLLVLADLAGGRWPEVAREAALGITARAQEHSPIGSLLLDICLVFTTTARERLFSRDLVGGLAGCGDRPWADLLKGKAPTETWLAQQLRPYGIKSKTIRIGEQLAKGYVQEDFLETFRRYIPKSAVEELKAELAERTVTAEEAKTSAPEEVPAEPGQQPEQAQAEVAPAPKVETKPKTEQVAGEDHSDPAPFCSRTDIDNPTTKQC